METRHVFSSLYRSVGRSENLGGGGLVRIQDLLKEKVLLLFLLKYGGIPGGGGGIPSPSCSNGPWLAPARSPVALLNGTVQLVGQHLRTKIPSFEIYCPDIFGHSQKIYAVSFLNKDYQNKSALATQSQQ